MSWQATVWALEAKEVTPTQKLVLICLANYADGKGVAFPGQKRLAEDCGVSDRAVRSNLAKLEELGYLTRRHRYRSDGPRTSDEYQLHMEVDYRKNVPHELPEDNDTKTGGLPEAGSGHINLSEDLTRKNLCTARAKEGAKTVRAELEGVMSPEQASAVIEHRNALKVKLTPLAARLLAKSLAACDDVQEALEMMVLKGWRTVKKDWVERERSNGNGTYQGGSRKGASNSNRREAAQAALRGHSRFGPGA